MKIMNLLTKENRRPKLMHLLISVGLNMLCFFLIELIWQFTPERIPQKKIESLKIKLQELDTLRIVGKKDGKENQQLSLAKQKNESSNAKKQKELQLQQLAMQQWQKPTPNIRKNLPIGKSADRLTKPAPKPRFFRLSDDKVKSLNSMQIASEQDRKQLQALDLSEFDIKLEVPKGVTEDELNKIEQIFYSFRKRVFENYVSAFIRALQKFNKNNPHYRIDGSHRRITFLSKVSFDKKGNVSKISIIQPGNEPKLQGLFQETLQGIGQLPNPPQDFGKDEQGFAIYYRLIVDS